MKQCRPRSDCLYRNYIGAVRSGSTLFSLIFTLVKWALTRENLSSEVANNKGADQPAHPRADWSAPLLFAFWKESHLNLLQEKFQFSSWSLVAEETGLKFALSETPKTGFVAMRPK